MARFLIILTLVTAALAGNDLAAAQSNLGISWKVQNPLIPIVGLQTVACPSLTVCLAAGDDTVFSTQDGGTTWRHTRVNKGSQINQVVCVSASSCFVLDEAVQGQAAQEVVIRTQDGGRTWTDVGRFPQTFLTGATCPTSTICYAIGGQLPAVGTAVHLWRSDDGGAHWTQPRGRDLYSVAAQSLTCPGPTLCYLGGNNGVVVTRDAGQSWTKRSFPAVPAAPGAPPPPFGVSSISCVGVDVCYAVMGDGRIVGTRNGWATSRQLRSGDPPGHPPFNHVTCPAPSDCYVSGFSDAVLATRDGGASWKTLQIGTSNGVQAIACAAPTTCTAVGAPTTILTTRDAGVTWHSGFLGTTNLLFAVSCLDASACTAVGAAGTILGTTNGGQTWKLETNGNHESLDAVSCATPTVCYAVGGSRYALPRLGPATADTVGPVILRTADGGTSWTVLARKPIGGRPLDLAGVACPAAGVCFATSDAGAILSTADGGRTWRWAHTGAYFQLRGIACPSATFCAAVGGLDAECNSLLRRAEPSSLRPKLDGCYTPEEGVIFVTQDAGRTWQRRFYRQVDMNGQAVTGAHLYTVSCPTPTTCFAAGHNIVVKSVDGGQTWRLATTKAPSGGPWPVVLALACASSATCWASYGTPTLLRTQDGGLTWTPGPTNPKPRAGPVLGVSCPALNTCYAVGGSGLILRLMSAAGSKQAHMPGMLPMILSATTGPDGRVYAVGGSGDGNGRMLEVLPPR